MFTLTFCFEFSKRHAIRKAGFLYVIWCRFPMINNMQVVLTRWGDPLQCQEIRKWFLRTSAQQLCHFLGKVGDDNVGTGPPQ